MRAAARDQEADTEPSELRRRVTFNEEKDDGYESDEIPGGFGRRVHAPRSDE